MLTLAETALNQATRPEILCYRRPMSRIPTLDGVRGVAALTVLVGHAANDGYLPDVLGHGSGQMAVGLFFLLSGFLMAFLYAHRPVTDMPAYAVHRFARVIPLYLAIVFFSIAVRSDVVWTFPIHSGDQIAEHLLFIHGVNTLWTIPVEVQFYVLFCLIWPWPKAAVALLAALQVVTAAIFYVAGLPTSTLPFWLHFFLIGSVTGLVWRKHGDVLLDRAERYGVLGWLVLLATVLALPGFRYSAGIHLLPHFMDPLTVLAAIALFWGALLQLGPLAAFSAGWARWLGKISYGVYLIHFPVLMSLEKTALPPWVVFPTAVALTLVLATVSFELFEDPVRRLFVNWVQRRRQAAIRPLDDGAALGSENLPIASQNIR